MKAFAWIVPACLALGCAFAPEPAPNAASPVWSAFSGERAFAELEKLVALGPRVAGTAAASSARGLVRAELESLGLEVHEDRFQGPAPQSVSLANLWADVLGTAAEAGLLVVATPLDSAPGAGPGANEGGSGAAVLLELARTLKEQPLAYPVRLLFLDGELLDAQAGFLGSQQAFRQLRETETLQRMLMLLYLHQVGDRELEIRRDRLSDRKLRELFFGAARKAQLGQVFAETAPYEEVRLGHVVFSSQRFTRVVALADLRYGGSEIPGEHWRTAGDDLAHCSVESLAAVGGVVRAGLEVAAARQQVVDRLTRPATRSKESHAGAPDAP